MIAAARVLAFLAGAFVVLSTLASAIKTVVVPRAEPVMLARWVFVGLRRPFDWRVRRAATWEDADRIMSRFAPFALMSLPLVWVAIVIAGFMPIYWALGVDWPGDTFEQSGSSLLTLGFAVDHHATGDLRHVRRGHDRPRPRRPADQLPADDVPAVLPAGGAGLAARRAGGHAADAGRHVPPGQADRLDPGVGRLLVRLGALVHRGRGVPHVVPGAVVLPQPAPRPVLDHGRRRGPRQRRAAGVLRSTCRASWQAHLCLRAGYLALRRISGSYGVIYDPDPAPTDPISITRDEFEDVLDRLAEIGVPLTPDRDQAWRDFAGWRVNYDTPLLALSGLLMAPLSPWSSDRSVNYRVRVLPAGLRRNG